MQQSLKEPSWFSTQHAVCTLVKAKWPLLSCHHLLVVVHVTVVSSQVRRGQNPITRLLTLLIFFLSFFLFFNHIHSCGAFNAVAVKFPPLTQEARFPHQSLQGLHGSQAWTLAPRPLLVIRSRQPSATLLQSLLWLCQPLQICLWKPNWPAGTPALQASFRSQYWGKEHTQRWGWHSRSRHLLRDLGGPAREVGTGCSSPCGQGHW